MRPLTDKQERFIQEYLVDLNATAAAKRAGYSPKTARQMGSENLSKPYIIGPIEAAQKKIADRLEITAERVKREMAVVGFSNQLHYDVDVDGNVLLTDGITEEAYGAIKRVKRHITITRRGDTDVKEVSVDIDLWNKNQALHDMATHLGLLGAKGTAEDPQVHKVYVVNVPGVTDANDD